MKESNNDHNKSTLTLFVIPVIFILLGLSVIGLSSSMECEQEKLIEEGWETIMCTVVNSGNGINTSYDFGVSFDEVEITDNVYHVTYNTSRGKRIDSLYDCKIRRFKDNEKCNFLVNPEDAHEVKHVLNEHTVTIFTVIGFVLILIGFGSCACGLRFVQINE